MHLRSTLKVYRKELRDILRDRRTLLSMILFPILLIPLLYLGLGAIMQNRMASLKEKRSVVAWFASDATSDIRRLVEGSGQVDLITDLPDTSVALDMLREKDIDAVVQIPDNFKTSLTGVIRGDESIEIPNINIFLDETRQTSEFAASKLRSVFSAYRENLVSTELSERGMRPELVKPFLMMSWNIASPEQMGRFATGFILPYMVIIMVLTGAMYPAIDLTAGEKERGTLETLLVSGVSRVDIVLGKFLTVLTASLVTACLSIASLGFTFTQGIKMFEEIASKISLSLDTSVILILLLTILPLAIIFSSLLMVLALFAKSYREAQSYVSPLMFLVIVPAMASVVPDVELTYQMALIPVLNVSLLLKQGLAGTLDGGILAFTMFVNLTLASFCLYLVVRMFRREKVLFRI